MYKYEMHLHSCGASACGVSESTEYIKAAKDCGFAGMVFTNHFFRGNSGIDKTLPWREFVSFYREDYLRAKELGDKHGIDVLFGIEEGFGGGRECLIYGLSPEIIAQNEDFSTLPISELASFVRSNGGFIACAHPFRHRNYITCADVPPNPADFDAIEVYNRANSAEDNIKAELFAKENNLPAISGGDVHNVSDFGKAGIVLPERAKTEAELVRLLKTGNYRLLAELEKENFGSEYHYE